MLREFILLYYILYYTNDSDNDGGRGALQFFSYCIFVPYFFFSFLILFKLVFSVVKFNVEIITYAR